MKKLAKHKEKYKIIAIDERDFLFHSVGSIRGYLEGETWADASMVPISSTAAAPFFLQGKVVEVREGDNQVDVLVEGELQSVAYDVLVVATGSSKACVCVWVGCVV